MKVKYISADLSTIEGVEKVKRLEEKIGLLVLSAGYEVNGLFEKTALESELKVLQVNVIATLQLSHHFSEFMAERGKGGILSIASLSGHMPNPYFSNYAGSKAYVLNLGASFYGELKPKVVDITVLSPGLTNTPMVADNGMDRKKTPMQAMQPSVVAETAGKHLISVPRAKNKMMAFMSKHSFLEMQAIMNEKMILKAMNKNKI